eukprot:363596-Chlamydomonas_euryale.AAC.8
MARCAAPRARLHAAMGATLLLVAVLCTSGAQALNLVSSAEGTVNIANGGLTTFGLNDPARGGSPVFQPGDGRSAEVDFSTIPGPTLIVQLGQARLSYGDVHLQPGLHGTARTPPPDCLDRVEVRYGTAAGTVPRVRQGRHGWRVVRCNADGRLSETPSSL